MCGMISDGDFSEQKAQIFRSIIENVQKSLARLLGFL